MSKRRVVVTGLGLITPLGLNLTESWDGLIKGVSGIDKITYFDASSFPVRIAGEVKGFDPASYIEQKEIKKMDRFIQFAIAATTHALQDASLMIDDSISERVGVCIGSGMGGLPTIEHYHKVLLERGYRKITPFFIPMLIINLASGNVSIKFGAKGPNSSIVTACATGTHSIGEAFRIIQRNDADVMIAGGTESCITPLGIAGFAVMRALSTRNDEPQLASRPFDIDRDGFVMGEGSGIMILEELEFAKNRGAKIYAEVIGYGMSADAYHLTAPSPDGEGAARCMRSAIKDACIKPSDINYINAHGTSTKFGDEIEVKAIRNVFGDDISKVAVSSTKSMIGHLLGAAGGVEAVISVLTVYNDIVPPTINIVNQDPECDIDCVANVARQMQVNCAMSNSFGFGGTNGCLIFRKYTGD
ncbi:MAG: beta-ketoacyl-ACP synthase II [Thermodesulfovibrionales bacterium]|nr:beta-ketoacyl-ACP synthase II [Thermodesulfovibrionales bacterium]